MKKTKILFFGTPIWELTNRHLKIFLENDANIIAFVEADISRISTTVDKDNSYESITSVANRLKKPIFCPKSMKDPDFIKYLKSFGADIFIICGFQFYLNKEILDIPPMGVLNFHSSLLPRHSGMHPGFFTIWYGDKETGMTVHYMDNQIDTGDMAYQSKVPVLFGDDVNTLYDRIWKTSDALIKQLLFDLDNRSVPRTPQDMSKYHYNYELSEKDFELDFRQPAEILFGRAKMMPGKFYFKLNNEKYFIDECTVVKEPQSGRKYELGKLFELNKKVIFITPKYYLQIDKIKNNNKEIDPLSLAT
jgi:methionyl-tRNA formyltransferase